MLYKKIKFILIIAGLSCVLSSRADLGDTATLVPGTGTYLDSQMFDIALMFPGPPAGSLPGSFSVINTYAFLNGADVSGWFKQCFQAKTLAFDRSVSLLCKRMSGAGFGVGTHTLNVDSQLSNGLRHRASATYTVVKTLNQNLLPATFLVPGSSPAYASGVFVSMGMSVRIAATGRMSTWAANANFPVSTPKGTLSCPSDCLLPGAMVGALLVKIGPTGRWMVAGENLWLMPDRSGELIFAVNDKDFQASWADNIGAYEVTVSR